MILVITKHLNNYLEIFITKKLQDEFSAVISALKNYAPRDNKYVEAKNKLLNNVENFYKGREKIIEGFKNKGFPFSQRKMEEEEKEEFFKYIENESKGIRYFFFKHYFDFVELSGLAKNYLK